MKTKIVVLLLFFTFKIFSQDTNFTAQDISVNSLIDGTLLTPNNVENPNLVIIIGGSGPTDRNGNQNFLKNNSLKKLAEDISENGIATYRYDKRVVKQIKQGAIDKNILFDDFVTDAISVIDYFKNTGKFNKIYVLGHSQGSLVGMLAAENKADGFISIAGAGQPIDQIVIEQIAKTYPVFTDDAKRIFESLRNGQKTAKYPPELAAIFNIEIQSFMMNWMQYNPQEEIKKLQIPILLINGTSDLQVEAKEATLLKEAAPKATLKIIDKMNHILVPITDNDNLENSKSYNEPNRQLSPELIEAITEFVK
ncbi:alpha/beta hydrolase [Yeosuana marina]|uniref:alpha/beta hydrolase n=1 Tax=Yeosuana marina TaxID=1565536 RepID=UPI0014214432|nr:alpha/beta hydrolase [Yeosuana marina]